MASSLGAPQCVHCGGASVKICQQITASGVSQFAWRCLSCDRWAENPPQWIPHSTISKICADYGKTRYDIRVVHDYSQNMPCVVCGAPGEWHHWAPRAFQDDFGDDWTQWPGASLCKFHHDLWHTIVTPALRKGAIADRSKKNS